MTGRCSMWNPTDGCMQIHPLEDLHMRPETRTGADSILVIWIHTA